MLNQLLKEIAQTQESTIALKATASSRLNYLLRQEELQAALKVAEANEDNQYSECCGFGQLFLDRFNFEMNCSYRPAPATARKYALQGWEFAVNDAIYGVDY